MSDKAQEEFEVQFLNGFSEKMRMQVFEKDRQGKYLGPGIQAEFERFRMHRAAEELKTAIFKALRLERMVAWLSHKLQRCHKRPGKP
ncbi:hypothetical protein SAMN05216178_3993 [Pseudomonas saponiphila]|uniref:Uncharacterized protein n=1 Tax=Pseudomonas saponiphila TaxID=556534 RepID=A0A1H4R158_9PSED|nr:hypothetical protein [Pseudomonas saponiphila]SEC25474.1 hypothetical protein SAMN05216178_3993 [Pseudomonas saponiphila]